MEQGDDRDRSDLDDLTMHLQSIEPSQLPSLKYVHIWHPGPLLDSDSSLTSYFQDSTSHLSPCEGYRSAVLVIQKHRV